MTTDWHGQAISMFFYDYVVVPKEPELFGTGYLQPIPDLYSKEKEMSALGQAVSAVALTSLSHRTSLDYLLNNARQRYGNALSLLEKSLRSEAAMKADNTLAAILVLDCYEVSYPYGGEDRFYIAYDSHVDTISS